MKEWIAMQGGDVSYIDDPDKLPISPIKKDYFAKSSGYVAEIHAENVGVASMLLGAGRKTKDDVIDLGAGIVLKVKIGDYVDANQPLATMYTSDSNRLNDCEKMLDRAFKLTQDKPEKAKLIHTMIK
jgi:pyrimidine-nucleoside phosphorylase